MLWHITFACRGRHTLFADECLRRQAVGRLLQVTGSELVLFSLVDDHLHLVLRCTRAVAGVKARGVLHALRSLGAKTLEHRDTRAVEGRAHMQRLVRYFLTQVEHHGIHGVRAALWSGSCFCDLVGARWGGETDLAARLLTILPRYRLDEAFSAVGLHGLEEVRPLSAETVRALGVARVKSAATFALCATEDLSGRGASEVRARRAVARLARWAGISAREVAWSLGRTPSAVYRLARAPLDRAAIKAVSLRLALEVLVEQQGGTRAVG